VPAPDDGTLGKLGDDPGTLGVGHLGPARDLVEAAAATEAVAGRRIEGTYAIAGAFDHRTIADRSS
jgi:hypothetical protein